MLIMALGIGLLSGYMSGHTLDEFMSTTILSVISVFLIQEIQELQKVK